MTKKALKKKEEEEEDNSKKKTVTNGLSKLTRFIKNILWYFTYTHS